MKKYIKNIRLVKNIRNYFRTKKIFTESEGQIKIDTPQGKLIFDFVKNNNIKKVLEIGTWNGLGSTMVLYNALKSSHHEFSITTLETDKIAFKKALKNLKGKKEIQLNYGRIIEISDLPDAESIDFKEHNLDPKNIEWLYQDIRRYKKTKNIYADLDSFYDFILFDGGEFSTFAEFKKLYKKTKFFCLDDIFTYKQYEVIKYIESSPSKFSLIKTVEDVSIYECKE